jgi:hypothetical protein
MTRIAYIDESQRADRYIMAALAVEHGSAAAVRQQLRLLTPKGIARRHMVKESDPGRRKMLDTFRELPGSDVVVCVVSSKEPVNRRRTKALTALVTELIGGGLDRLVLDHVDLDQRRRDEQTLARTLHAAGRQGLVTYSHEPAHSTEPMLWVPDAAAWCAGRKDRWRHELIGWATVFDA